MREGGIPGYNPVETPAIQESFANIARMIADPKVHLDEKLPFVTLEKGADFWGKFHTLDAGDQKKIVFSLLRENAARIVLRPLEKLYSQGECAISKRELFECVVNEAPFGKELVLEHAALFAEVMDREFVDSVIKHGSYGAVTELMRHAREIPYETIDSYELLSGIFDRGQDDPYFYRLYATYAAQALPPDGDPLPATAALEIVEKRSLIPKNPHEKRPNNTESEYIVDTVMRNVAVFGDEYDEDDNGVRRRYFSDPVGEALWYEITGTGTPEDVDAFLSNLDTLRPVGISVEYLLNKGPAYAAVVARRALDIHNFSRFEYEDVEAFAEFDQLKPLFLQAEAFGERVQQFILGNMDKEDVEELLWEREWPAWLGKLCARDATLRSNVMGLYQEFIFSECSLEDVIDHLENIPEQFYFEFLVTKMTQDNLIKKELSPEYYWKIVEACPEALEMAIDFTFGLEREDYERLLNLVPEGSVLGVYMNLLKSLPQEELSAWKKEDPGLFEKLDKVNARTF